MNKCMGLSTSQRHHLFLLELRFLSTRNRHNEEPGHPMAPEDGMLDQRWNTIGTSLSMYHRLGPQELRYLRMVPIKSHHAYSFIHRYSHGCGVRSNSSVTAAISSLSVITTFRQLAPGIVWTGNNFWWDYYTTYDTTRTEGGPYRTEGGGIRTRSGAIRSEGGAHRTKGEHYLGFRWTKGRLLWSEGGVRGTEGGAYRSECNPRWPNGTYSQLDIPEYRSEIWDSAY